MFTIGHDIVEKPKNRGKHGFSNDGTTLANDKKVKRSVNYKEVILVFGIVIAVLVALTLWDNRPQRKTSRAGTTSFLDDGLPVTGKNFFRVLIAF